MTNSIIEIQNLRYSYEDKPDVLRDINLTVERDSRVGVVGPNGSGKTTLFLLLSGVLTPSSGRIVVNAKPVVPKAFNPDVGYVFQNPDDQLFSPTVWDDVAFGPMNLHLPEAEMRTRTENALQVCSSTHLARRPSHHLSGGEKRMVAIATILAMQPSILLYDEPTSNLDLRAKRQVVDLLKRRGLTELIISHDLEFVREVCDKVCVLHEGRLHAFGPCKEILGDRQKMEDVGLEVPHSLRNTPG